MTVEDTSTKVNATGNGVATSFSFSPLVIYDSTQLEVTKVTLADGTEELLVEGSGSNNYSVSPTTAYPSTGSIVYPADEVTPMTSDYKLTIRRVLPLTQLTDLNNQGGYFADVQENQFDKLVMQNLQQQEELDRSVKVAVGYSGAADFTIPAPEALHFPRWNSTGLALENIEAADLGAAVLSGADPEAVSLSAASAGVSGDVSRRDHAHLLPTVTVAKGGTGATDADTALTNLGLTANGKSLVTAADYAAMKALLNLEIGTDVQAYDALLASIAGLGSQAAGDLLYLSAADTIARLGIGTEGQIVKSVSGVPAWADEGGGVWQEIAEGTISDAAALAVTFTPGSWRAIRLIFTDIVSATDDVNFTLRTSTDGGSNYDAGASDYQYFSRRWLASSDTVVTNRSTGDVNIILGASQGNAAGERGVYDITLYDPATAAWKSIVCVGFSVNAPAGSLQGIRSTGARVVSADVDGIQVRFSSGNITSGRYKVLGLTE